MKFVNGLVVNEANVLHYLAYLWVKVPNPAILEAPNSCNVGLNKNPTQNRLEAVTSSWLASHVQHR